MKPKKIEWKNSSRGVIVRHTLIVNSKTMFWVVKSIFPRYKRPFELYRITDSMFGDMVGRFKTLADAQRRAEELLEGGGAR